MGLGMVGASLVATGVGAATSGAQMGIQAGRSKKQHKRQKELMLMQRRNQSMLNKEGAGLQMDMWNKTNYEEQLKKMKEAGLSPGLMYGGSGASGSTTGSQGGGSAQSGNTHAPQNIPVMDMGAMMMAKQMQKIDQEIELMKQQGKNLGEDTKLKSMQEVLTGLKAREQDLINAKTTEKLDAEIKLYVNNATKAFEDANRTRTLTEEEKKEIIAKTLELTTKSTLNKSQVELNETQEDVLVERLYQYERSITIQEGQLDINKNKQITNEENSITNRQNANTNWYNALTAEERLKFDKKMGWEKLSLETKKMWINAGTSIISSIAGAIPKPKAQTGNRKQAPQATDRKYNRY